MAKNVFDASRSRRRPMPRQQADRSSAREIVRAVRRGERNPFRQGSPEGIAWAFTEELKRHAGAGRSPLAATARKALDSHDPQPPRDVPPLPGRKPWAWKELFPVSAIFASRIAAAEGAARDYASVNGDIDGAWHALGRYQMQRGGLHDIGVLTGEGAFADSLEMDGPADFVADHPFQDMAFAAYIQKKYKTAQTLGLFADVGQELQGIKATFPTTEAGIVAAMHREGEEAVRLYLKHLRAHDRVSDPSTFPEGTIADSERPIAKAFLAVETRLRTFADVPLSADRLVPPLVTETTWRAPGEPAMMTLAATLLCIGCGYGFQWPTDGGSFRLHKTIEGNYWAVVAAMGSHGSLHEFFMTGRLDIRDIPMMFDDTDRDGIEEAYILIDHPSACDPQGCLFLTLEERAPKQWTPVATERRPVVRASMRRERFVAFGDDVMYLTPQAGFAFDDRIEGQIVFDWLDSVLPVEVAPYVIDFDDLWVGQYDIDDDGYGEVFVFPDHIGYCLREGCGGVIVDFSGLDGQGRQQWTKIGWFRSVGGSSARPYDHPFFVSEVTIEGHHTLVSELECVVWRDGAYGSVLWEKVDDGLRALGCMEPTSE